MEASEKPTNELPEVENKEALELLQDKVIWKQRYDIFFFQLNTVQQMIELQRKMIKPTPSQTVGSTTSAFIHCNEEMTQRVLKAIDQLESDYISFFNHHQKKIYIVDADEYRFRRWSMNKIKTNLDSMRKRYTDVKHPDGYISMILNTKIESFQ